MSPWHTHAERPAWRPRALAVQRRRYPAAIVDIFDHQEGLPSALAGELRRIDPVHVFDFEDGLRLIVSRERTLNGRLHLHLSASVEPGTPVAAARAASDEWFKALAIARWQALAESRSEPAFLGVSPAARAPHWYLELPVA